jgi:hypothetical protein
MTHGWYMERRKSYRRWARVCRAVGIIGFISTMLWPPFMLVGLIDWASATLNVSKDHASQFGYLLAAIGGATLTVEKMAGFSSAWIRTSATMMQLHRGYDTLQMDWVKACVKGNKKVAGDDTQDLDITPPHLDVLVQGVEKLWEVVGGETSEWSKNYRTDLQQLRNSLDKGQPKRSNSGQN